MEYTTEQAEFLDECAAMVKAVEEFVDKHSEIISLDQWWCLLAAPALRVLFPGAEEHYSTATGYIHLEAWHGGVKFSACEAVQSAT